MQTDKKNSKVRIVDLTFDVHEGMQTFPVPWHPVVEVTQLGRFGVEDRVTRKLTIGTHTGTHMDAPAHFIKGGKTIDQVPLDQLVGPAFVCDLSDIEPRTAISKDVLAERCNGQAPERIIMRFDWSKHFGTREYYLGHAFLEDEAAQWLIDGGCRLLAMDTPMPDNPRNGSGSPNDSPIHKIVLGAEAVLVEYLTNLDQVQGTDVHLTVAPLKLREGDGSPVRCFVTEYV